MNGSSESRSCSANRVRRQGQGRRACKRVRAMHAQVRGELAEEVGPYPKGTPYLADDPSS